MGEQPGGTETGAVTVALRCRNEESQEYDPDAKGGLKLDSNSCTVVRNSGIENGGRSYLFDRVLPSSVNQDEMYNRLMVPLEKKFRSGYDCCVVAYGGAGSGKSFTLYGDQETDHIDGSLMDSDGVIPRFLYDTFEKLHESGKDFVINCSFIEIYNEELRDLLDENSAGAVGKKLRIVESNQRNCLAGMISASSSKNSSPVTNSKKIPTATVRKNLGRQSLSAMKSGTGLSISRSNSFPDFPLKQQQNSKLPSSSEKICAVHVQNLQELYLDDAAEGVRFLKLGLKNKRLASNKPNDYSKRAHIIFTLTLYCESNEENFRMSKFSFVHLGSAESASKMDSSLSSLKDTTSADPSIQNFNRVVNKIFESSAERLYKNSKLTYLLHDIFSGEAISLFIVTISNDLKSLTETQDVLEMASKFKSIECNCQLGPLVSKALFLKIVSSKLTKAKADLLSVKLKEGIYMSQKNYKDLTSTLDRHRREIESCKTQMQDLTDEGANLRKEKRVFEELNEVQRLKLQSLKESISSVYSQIEKQQRREHDLINLSDKLQKVVNEMKLTLGDYTERESFFKSQMNQFFDNELAKLKHSLTSNLTTLNEQLSGENNEIESSLKLIDEEISTMVEASKLSVRNAFSSSLEKMASVFLHNFDGFRPDIEKLQKFNQHQNQHLSELLSDLSEEFNSFKQYMTEKFLKNNHEEHLTTYVNKTYHQLQELSDQFISQFNQSFEKFLEGNKKIMEANFHAVTSDIIENEMRHFNPEKEKWIKSMDLIERSKNATDTYKMNQEQLLEQFKDKEKHISKASDDTLAHLDRNFSKQKDPSELLNSSAIINNEINKMSAKNIRSKKYMMNHLSSNRKSLESFDILSRSVKYLFKEDTESNENESSASLSKLLNSTDQQKLLTNFKHEYSNTSKQNLPTIKPINSMHNPMNEDLKSLADTSNSLGLKRPAEEDLDSTSKLKHKTAHN